MWQGSDANNLTKTLHDNHYHHHCAQTKYMSDPICSLEEVLSTRVCVCPVSSAGIMTAAEIKLMP